MKKSRLLVSDVAEIAGLNPATIRKLANEGKIESRRDWNNWRIFAPEALDIAKELAGIKSEKELLKVGAGR